VVCLDHHFSPPTGTFDEDLSLAWWKFKTLQDAVHEDHRNGVKIVRPVWETFEKRAFTNQRAFEKRALRLLRKDKNAACADLTQYCADLALQACREAEDMAGKVLNCHLDPAGCCASSCAHAR
jgi:dipeptidase